MSDKPILCAGSVVRAILDGRQTQDRRPIKAGNKPIKGSDELILVKSHVERRWFWCGQNGESGYPWDEQVIQPWQVGDHLWVRETLHREVLQGWDAPDVATYAADLSPVIGTNPPASWCGRACWQWKRKPAIPSIHMPKWAARIWLEALDVRPERLQEISNKDIVAEGIAGFPNDSHGFRSEILLEFMTLWDSLYAKRGLGWDDDPWVWRTVFRRMEAANE